jgi:hypothetical protein
MIARQRGGWKTKTNGPADELGAELEALQKAAGSLPEDPDALLEHLAKLRTLAVYLNVHASAPAIHEA